MIQCKLDTSRMYNFLITRDLKNSLATICMENEAEVSFDEHENLYVRHKVYSNEEYEKILSEAQEWEIKLIRTEEWDPSFGHTEGKVITESIQPIESQKILVKDGKFTGLISYANCGEKFVLSLALVSEYNDEPIMFCSSSGFGSSDRDMMYTNNYYLKRK